MKRGSKVRTKKDYKILRISKNDIGTVVGFFDHKRFKKRFLEIRFPHKFATIILKKIELKKVHNKRKRKKK